MHDNNIHNTDHPDNNKNPQFKQLTKHHKLLFQGIIEYIDNVFHHDCNTNCYASYFCGCSCRDILDSCLCFWDSGWLYGDLGDCFGVEEGSEDWGGYGDCGRVQREYCSSDLS